MTERQSTDASPTVTDVRERRRLVVYAVSHSLGTGDGAVTTALTALRPIAARLVVVVPSSIGADAMTALSAVTDAVLVHSSDRVDSSVYPWALEADPLRGRFDEVVLTGDSWFGPTANLAAQVSRMEAVDCEVWGMIENALGEPEAFPDAGFPAPEGAWVWVAVRAGVLANAVWESLWATGRRSDRPAPREHEFLSRLRALGLPPAYAFPAAEFPSQDPGLFTPLLLVDAGCPFVRRDVFTRYPPYLHRFAVIGRDILAGLEQRGYPTAGILQNLVRSTPPKALNANAGLLEVLPGTGSSYDPNSPLRIAAVVHITDLEGTTSLLERLRFLPAGYDLFITTTDGKRATRIQELVESNDHGARSFDVRVTPANRGRDMSDFFVGCRDVVLSSDYDLVVKLHSRRMRRKTVNLKRYFRRYQYENLLDSSGYVADLIGLFQKEPSLGLVFPPMMHIGYNIMGTGWGTYRDAAQELSEQLGIHVPFDNVSPLAPYGGMWIGRPEALRLLTSQRWRYGDYRTRNAHRYYELAKVQERLVVYAAAELGYHARTVLTPEHAAISHTVLETKADELFSTTRGWPVEQIHLMQRAGFIGHGGVVALSRMYVRLNHPRASRVLMPLYELALRAFVAVKVMRMGARRFVAMLTGRPLEGSR